VEREDSVAKIIKCPPRSLIILCGPAGSGKSTFAKKHFVQEQVVSSDACRALVCDDPANIEASADAFDVLYSIVRARMKFERITIVDATTLTKESRKRLLNIAKEYDAPTTLIFFQVPLEICLERNRARDRFVPVEVIERHCQLAEKAAGQVEQEGFSQVHFLQPAEIDNASLMMDFSRWVEKQKVNQS